VSPELPAIAPVIAVDGPAAAGKGTLARRLAAHFGYAYLDTGLIYRAVGARTLDGGNDPEDVAAATAAAQALTPTDLARDDLRGDDVAVAASKVAAIPAVRAALLDFQRNFAARPPGGRGAVLDGRDVGTVVCPDAGAKLFLRASLDERARRRVKELRERGLTAIHSRVLRDMEERDARDARRAVAPLEPSEDAFVIDTGGLDPDDVFAAAMDFISTRTRFD